MRKQLIPFAQVIVLVKYQAQMGIITPTPLCVRPWCQVYAYFHGFVKISVENISVSNYCQSKLQ